MTVFLILISFFEFFSESSVKDQFGIISIYSQRKQTEYIEKHNISFLVSGQKKFLEIFQIRLDVPSGITKGKFVLSDLIVSLTINPNDIAMNPSFSMGFEFPTGTSPATSGRLIISPRLSLTENISESIYFNFLIVGNFSPDKSEKRYNTLFPHTFNEILCFVGLGININGISLQPDLGLIYEKFKHIGFQPQLKIISKISNNFNISLISFLSIGEKTIRRGYGAGVSFTYSF